MFETILEKNSKIETIMIMMNLSRIIYIYIYIIHTSLGINNSTTRNVNFKEKLF